MDADDTAGTGRELLALDAEEASARLDAMPIGRQLETVLALASGRQRMELILLSPRCPELVAALPPEDLLLTIKDVGDQDAVPLVDLSTNPQLTYLLDLETWIREGMDVGQLAHWLRILFEAGNARVVRWIRSVDFEMLLLLFERTMHLLTRDELESLPDPLLARIITPDDTHHLLVKLGADYSLLKQLIDILYAEDRELFFGLTGNLGTSPLAETEEQALRWRNGRLADRGWPDLEEAQALYTPVRPGEVRAGRMPQGFENHPRYPLQPRTTGRLLGEGKARLPDEAAMGRVAAQLANLINRVVIADGWIPGEMESLERAMERVGGYLEIGLQELGAVDGDAAAGLLGSVPLLNIFRVAHGAIQERAERARRLFASPVGRLGIGLRPPLLERLAAAAQARPMFLPGTAGLPREFRDSGDLASLDRDLDLTEVAHALAEALGPKPFSLPDPFPPGSHPESREGLGLESLLLTAFARHRAGLEPAVAPLPGDRLPALVRGWREDPRSLETGLGRWARERLTEPPPALERLLLALRRLLEDQVLGHEPGGLDPRFVEGLWVTGTTRG